MIVVRSCACDDVAALYDVAGDRGAAGHLCVSDLDGLVADWG